MLTTVCRVAWTVMYPKVYFRNSTSAEKRRVDVATPKIPGVEDTAWKVEVDQGSAFCNASL